MENDVTVPGAEVQACSILEDYGIGVENQGPIIPAGFVKGSVLCHFLDSVGSCWDEPQQRLVRRS